MKTNRKLSIRALICLTLLLCSGTTAFAQTPTLRANGKIAFSDVTSEGQWQAGISVINPDGTGRTQLTQTKCQPADPGMICGDFSPSWSPDGKQIAFIRSPRPGTWSNWNPGPDFSAGADVFVMDADGGNQRQLTHSGSVISSRPAWSPDGTKIVFVVGTSDWGGDLQVINADGSGLRTIGRGGDPAWSPDGSKLVFRLEVGLYVMNPDGSGNTQITAPKSTIDGWDYDWVPAWSPDGRRIVFNRSAGCDNDGNCQSVSIWTVNADGSNPAKLADIATYGLAWSPDGTKIVFRWWPWLPSVEGDLFTMEADGSNVTRLTNTPGEFEMMPSWQPVALPPPPDNNPINDAQFFVRQHYRDFLNRDPDPDGLAFWTSEILSCGSDAGCIEAKRINVSAAYFLSIEFQETGYELYRLYKAAYGNRLGEPAPIRFDEFLADTHQIAGGVIVNQTGWQQVLENNKDAFTRDFVQRSRFTTSYPAGLSDAEFVDRLNSNAGQPLSQTESDRLVSDLAGGTKTRAQVLRAVAEDSDLIAAEFNRAFVLMQYFGYLRRNPNDAPDGNFDGYGFWLNKLNQFNGNYTQAEMVKAFLSSIEYRRRFGS